MTTEADAFVKDTRYRLLVEVSRYWLIEHWLRTHELPDEAVWFVYPNGPEACLDWGNPPGRSEDGLSRPLRGKRIRITLSVEEG